MFLPTPRLLLRPPWPEDAPALLAAIAHWEVIRMTAKQPWPFTLADARAQIADARIGRDHLSLFITARDTGDLVGGVGWNPPYHVGTAPDLFYWITPAMAGRGYATEAARAVLALAFDIMRHPRLEAGHFTDNPASGIILERLGFRSTGRAVDWPSRARGGESPSVEYTLDRPAIRRTPA